VKLLHSSTTMLTTKEFNKLSDKIIDKLYGLNPDIQEIYDIHVNYVDDVWRIDFLPLVDQLPVIKVDTYTDQDDAGGEVLKVSPALLTDFPGKLKIGGDDSYGLCVNYVALFEFLVALYDFEYRLS